MLHKWSSLFLLAYLTCPCQGRAIDCIGAFLCLMIHLKWLAYWRTVSDWVNWQNEGQKDNIQTIPDNGQMHWQMEGRTDSLRNSRTVGWSNRQTGWVHSCQSQWQGGGYMELQGELRLIDWQKQKSVHLSYHKRDTCLLWTDLCLAWCPCELFDGSWLSPWRVSMATNTSDSWERHCQVTCGISDWRVNRTWQSTVPFVLTDFMLFTGLLSWWQWTWIHLRA